ncbi:hypothetical protein EDD86DRAFT_175016, partial [Gorgonomyces haynaldii]
QITIVVASATGVPKEFYTKFALYFQQHCHVLLFDYTGIGKSIQELKQLSHLSIKRDWAKDTTLVVEHAATLSPKVFYVAHSVGGHLLGFLPLETQSKIARALFVSCNVPFRDFMPSSGAFLWPVMGEVSAQWCGYFPASTLGLGLDLPKNVGRQWAYWSRFPDYMTHNPKTKQLFDSCTIPFEQVGFEDDHLSNRKGMEQILTLYPSCPRRLHYLKPSDVGERQVGHVGFF